MLHKLKNVTFRRSYKPDNVKHNTKPGLVTFSDGSPNSYGAVAYARWRLRDESVACRLIMSRAKLGPLNYQGETVRNELSGATFASRLYTWILEQSTISFGKHFPFLDSRIVQDMIVKESYGFNTFAGLRVAEIQQKTEATAWNHIGTKENIADILTRGTTPEMIGSGTTWQSGPTWLTEDPSNWPVSKVRLEDDPRI